MFVFLKKEWHKDKEKREREVKPQRLVSLLVAPPLIPSVSEGDETLILLLGEELWLRNPLESVNMTFCFGVVHHVHFCMC